jgi:hypothetical protein
MTAQVTNTVAYFTVENVVLWHCQYLKITSYKPQTL